MRGGRPGRGTLAVAAEPAQLRAKNTAHKKSNSETIKAAVDYTRTKDKCYVNQPKDPIPRPTSPAFRRIGLCRLEGNRAPLAPFVNGFTKALRRSLRAFLIPWGQLPSLSHPAPTLR